MATLTETQLGSVYVALVVTPGQPTPQVLVTSQTLAADGTPIREYGPKDVYALLGATAQGRVQTLLATVVAQIKSDLGIA